MAPSRDRLLHFGFKATVSDRGRELGGREGRVWQHRLLGGGGGEKRQDVGGWGGTRQKAQVLGGLMRAPGPRRGGELGAPVLRAVVRLSSLSRIREHARTSTRLSPSHTDRHTDTQTLPCRSGSRWACRPGRRERARAAPRSGCSRADRRRLRRGWGEGWSRAAERSSPPPPHAAPRPGRLCPMRSGVAGRWRVFLFWVEVEAEGREELATISGRRRRRRGRWRRPSRSREVFSPRRRPPPAAPRPPPGPGTPGPARGRSPLHSARRSAGPRPHPPAS